MTTKFFSFLLLLSGFTTIRISAQFHTDITGTTYTTDKVGIGTSTPTDPLTVTSTLPINISSLRSFGGGNLTSGTSGGGIYLGSFDPSVPARYTGALMRFWATENWVAGSAQGSALTFETVANGTNTLLERLRIDNNGNVGIGITNPLSPLHVYRAGLGSAKGNSLNITTFASNGGSSGNRVMQKLWLLRDTDAGIDWTTTRFHDGVSIDGSYLTPGVDTKTWWERDPYNNIQSWGTAASTYMTINAGNVGIGTITPFEPLSIVSGNGNTIGLYRSITGGNPTTAGFAGSMNFGTVDPSASTVKYTGAQIQAKATEEWVPGTAQGTALSFRTVSNGGTTPGERLRIDQNGNIGIGTATPVSKFEIVGGATLQGMYNPANAMFKISGGGNLIMDGNEIYSADNLSLGYAPTGTFDIGTVDANGFTSKMHFLSNGNILIGKPTQTNAAYKVDIGGFVRADKLVVNTTGADFVFEPEYTLPSLQSVELFVRKYHHLPGIASASEMQNNGLDIGEHQTKLLQKTEELTLYAIDQDKKMKNLQLELDAKTAEIKELKGALESVLIKLEKIERLQRNTK